MLLTHVSIKIKGIKEKRKEPHVSKKRWGACFCAEVMQPAALIDVVGIDPSGCETDTWCRPYRAPLDPHEPLGFSLI